MTYKTRENRVRRVAQRRGFRLVKIRRIDPCAIDHGAYQLIAHYPEVGVDIPASGRYPPGSYLHTLAEIEAYLAGGAP